MRRDGGGAGHGLLAGRQITRQDGGVGQQGVDQAPARVSLARAHLDVGQRDRVPRVSEGRKGDRGSDLLCAASPALAARHQRKHQWPAATVLAEAHLNGELDPTSVQPGGLQDQLTTKEATWLSQPVTAHQMSVALGG